MLVKGQRCPKEKLHLIWNATKTSDTELCQVYHAEWHRYHQYIIIYYVFLMYHYNNNYYYYKDVFSSYILHGLHLFWITLLMTQPNTLGHDKQTTRTQSWSSVFVGCFSPVNLNFIEVDLNWTCDVFVPRLFTRSVILNDSCQIKVCFVSIFRSAFKVVSPS